MKTMPLFDAQESSIQQQSMCYVGIKPCGCMVACAVDKPQYRRDNNALIKEWLQIGYRVERIGVEEARLKLTSCKCEVKK